ncbi:reductase [Ornithinicoccus hortensis]|uniref:Nucleoside-diphosphate-sugar epimerase n=1 Tax=Ornithinicoccus hortensis TaxID=82346 RepID=A0A542YMM2_9MICO|nr:reductase [Ornithinicoccus hortensis]TQL49329.1 nucleoside-diphosphate-sugar epimerase [Ornithinicoccus hortensis]
MANRAVILGGTGTLTRTAELMADHDWRVTVTARNPDTVPGHLAGLGVDVALVDRDDEAATAAVVGAGADLLVDGQCYTPEHARSLARWSRACGSTVMLSAKAVYVDSRGRHTNSPEAPVWDGTLTEDRPTMEFHGEPYASAEGYGANKAEAERVLRAEGQRMTVLRPSKIHGAHLRRARLWEIVLRVLCDRRRMPVRRGDLVESTTSTEVIARAVWAAAQHPATRVLNVADSDPRPARDLVREVAELAGGPLDLVDVDGCDCPESVGRLPWTVDMVLDTTALRALGVPDVSFAQTAAAEVDWLRSLATRTDDGAWAIPDGIEVGTPDLAAEDACLRRVRG